MPRPTLPALFVVALAVALVPAAGHAAVFDAEGNLVPDERAGDGAAAWTAVRVEDGVTGIGALHMAGFGDVCTAFLVDTGVDAGPAYVATNAHCNFFEHLGFDPLAPDEVRTDQWTSYEVVFDHFVEVPAARRTHLWLRRLTYVTEAGTDLALFEVWHTQAEVRAMGFAPLQLAPAAAPAGARVQLIGIPLLHVPARMQSLQRSGCTLGEDVVLRNGDYLAPDSVVHACSSIAGFSGGPLLDEAGRVALINSHGATDASDDPDCTYASRPCEVEADGSTVVREDRNYAQRIHGLAGCFDDGGRFDLALPTCTLPGGAGADPLPRADVGGAPGEATAAASCAVGHGRRSFPLVALLSLAILARRRR